MPLQPSPATVLPSSHCSIPPWLLMPSPQPGGTGSVPPDPVAPVPVEPLRPPMPRLFEPPVEPPTPRPVPPVPVVGCVGWTPAVQPTTTPRTTDAAPNAKRVVGRKTSCNISAPYRPGAPTEAENPQTLLGTRSIRDLSQESEGQGHQSPPVIPHYAQSSLTFGWTWGPRTSNRFRKDEPIQGVPFLGAPFENSMPSTSSRPMLRSIAGAASNVGQLVTTSLPVWLAEKPYCSRMLAAARAALAVVKEIRIVSLGNLCMVWFLPRRSGCS